MRNVFFIVTFIFSFFNLSAVEFESLKKYLPKAPVILDCGAATGTSSLMLNRVFPDALILAVEADPLNYKTLVQTVKGVPKIVAFNFILSEVDGTKEFYLNDRERPDNQQGSIFQPSQDHWYWDIKLENQPTLLPSRRLDTFCKENGISKIDFLFLDMQGAEYAMLQASAEIFPKASVICTEVLFERIYENCPLYSDIKAFLERAGFTEIKLYYEHHSWGDAVFIKNELL